MAKVSVDLATGTATVAGHEITVGEHPDGLRLHGPDGPVLRALSFGQRRFAVRAAEGCPDPADALARSVGFLALGRDPEDAAVEALALFLAGAREDAGGPGLTEAALAVLRVTGWTATQLDDAGAASVDDLARGLIPAAPDADDGWTRLELAPATVTETRAELAADLLARAARRPLPEDYGREVRRGPGEEYGRVPNGPSTQDTRFGAAPMRAPGAGPGAPPSGSAADAPRAAEPSTADGPGTRPDRPGRPGRYVGTTPANAEGSTRSPKPDGFDVPRFPADPFSATGPGHPPPGRGPWPVLPATEPPAAPGAVDTERAWRPGRQQGAGHRPSWTARRSAPPLPAPGTWTPIPKPATAPERAGTLITGPWAPLAEGSGPPLPATTPDERAAGDPVLRLVADDEDLAERLARVLHDEADLRGMAP
ncbi:hypothetical protein [Phytomonospora endophytica]|uniref:Uncharacterized protein n=1 Tax=Phytomonospora endophytica TaxID=714109 RepID=A0A841FL61_9ACTN|nr:hypothetical protein [Phytomonospora endophytica]MBB6033927.1 hypothetical protein [Phytomonospora endophytica]GIG64552.1 hypothetical protein Pen01_08470 [Phytomonospora endophytica]